MAARWRGWRDGWAAPPRSSCRQYGGRANGRAAERRRGRDGGKDRTTMRCGAARRKARRTGWQVISDTGYPGYTEIPERVVEGYGTLFEEAEEQMTALGAAPPSLVMVQAGVGGLLSAAVRHFRGGDWAARRCSRAWNRTTPIACWNRSCRRTVSRRSRAEGRIRSCRG